MHKDALARLESVGSEAVLLEIARGSHGQPDSQLRSEVEAWLRSKQVAAEAAASDKRDAREEATLSIAKEANAIALSARRSFRYDRTIAITAVIIAAIAAREDMGSFIGRLLAAFS